MLALSLARRIDVAKPCEIDRSVVRESDRAKGAGPIRRAGFLPFQMFCILLFPTSTPIVPLPRKIAPDKMLSSPTPSLTRISVSSGPFDGTRMTRFVPRAADGHFLRVSPEAPYGGVPGSSIRHHYCMVDGRWIAFRAHALG
jgi:hypothetical protein